MRLATLVLVACAANANPASAPIDRVSRERDVGKEIDDFHDAAAHADEERLIGHLMPDGIFMGTDANERWSPSDLRAYAHPRFSQGKGWVFHVKRRAITLSRDGEIAWFDEDLQGEKLGAARGSGVLVRKDGRYLLAQYNLALTIPNERFLEVRALIDR